ncbi:MAG: transposase, partial [candidate division NC10 bacterium]|nr:transposase [candidate division NC10 bacterium]
AEFDAWRGRDLAALPVLYLFLDAIFLPLRQGSHEKEGVLCAYGVLESGRKVLLHLALGNRESYDAWLSFLHDLTGRGLGEPVLVCTDGNPGLRRALREVFPHALKQRCLVHKMRNLLGKLPKAAIAAMKRLLRPVFEARDYPTVLRKGRELIARFRARFPSAMACLEEDLEACLVHLKLPREHRQRIRTTNLLERLFGEGKRRTKIIPRFPTEQSCLTLLCHPAHRVQDVARGEDDAGPLARDRHPARGTRPTESEATRCVRRSSPYAITFTGDLGLDPLSPMTPSHRQQHRSEVRVPQPA